TGRVVDGHAAPVQGCEASDIYPSLMWRFYSAALNKRAAGREVEKWTSGWSTGIGATSVVCQVTAGDSAATPLPGLFDTPRASKLPRRVLQPWVAPPGAKSNPLSLGPPEAC